MKDKYFLLNGRSYPERSHPSTRDADDGWREPFRAAAAFVINIPAGKKALCASPTSTSRNIRHCLTRDSDECHAINAKLLRDQAGNNLNYNTNSITLAGGESIDVILDATDTTKYPSGSVFYLYTPNLDHLSNDAENFGGLMTEVRIN